MMAGNVNGSNLNDGRLEALEALGGKCTIKAFKALALNPARCGSLSHLGMNEIVALAKEINGDSAAALWAPVEDVRRAAKLIGEAVADNAKRETFKGAPVELVLQLGPGFCTRWHIVSGGYLINITGGIAAVMGRKTVKRDRRSWVNWRNGYDDLRYHVSESFGVEISVHVI